MMLLYKILNALCSPFLGLVFVIRLLRGKEVFDRATERWGISGVHARPKGRLTWVHATSVGEVASVLPLINALVEDKKFIGSILLTSTTVGSLQFLKTKGLPNRVVHQLCPVENIFAIRAFLKFWRPNLALFVESEFWPCIISETAKICKVLSINTSISDASLKHWRLAMPLLRSMLKLVFKFVPQSLHDVEVLKLIGMHNIEYIGHLKYAVPSQYCSQSELKQLKRDTAGRKIVLFISTHEGEELMAAQIYKTLRQRHKALLFVLIPRHVGRAAGVCELLRSHGFEVTPRSQCLKGERQVPKSAEFYVVDTMGEVSLFASIAPISVMGGSFVPIGGHNIIEPTRCGAVVIAGPHMFDSKNLCEEFEEHKAAMFVNNQTECIRAIEQLWADKSLLARYQLNAKLLLKSKSRVLTCLKRLILREAGNASSKI